MVVHLWQMGRSLLDKSIVVLRISLWYYERGGFYPPLSLTSTRFHKQQIILASAALPHRHLIKLHNFLFKAHKLSNCILR